MPVIRSPARRLRRLSRLGVAKLGQRRIDDARIAPRRAEMEVEFALAVAQQDHGRGNTGRSASRQPGGRSGNCLCPGRMRAYL